MAWSRRGMMRLKVQGVGPIAPTIRTRKSRTDAKRPMGDRMNGRSFSLMKLSRFRLFALTAKIQRSDPGRLAQFREPHAPVRQAGRRPERQAGLVDIFSISPRIHATNPCVIPLPALFTKRFAGPLRTRRPRLLPY